MKTCENCKHCYHDEEMAYCYAWGMTLYYYIFRKEKCFKWTPPKTGLRIGLYLKPKRGRGNEH